MALRSVVFMMIHTESVEELCVFPRCDFAQIGHAAGVVVLPVRFQKTDYFCACFMISRGDATSPGDERPHRLIDVFKLTWQNLVIDEDFIETPILGIRFWSGESDAWSRAEKKSRLGCGD